MPLASPSTTHHAAESPSNRTGLAITALIFGVLAAGLALTAATGGVLPPGVWYLVVALAVVTLCCGLLSVGRRHHRSTAGGAIAWIGTVGGVIALVLGVWGMTDMLRATHYPVPAAAPSVQVLHPSADRTAPPPPAPTTPVLAGPQLDFGQTYEVDNVTVRITGPDEYRPRPMASSSDGSAIVRPVKFIVTITNNTSAALNANGVGVDGLVNGMTVGHIYDTEIQGLAQDIQPGQTVTYPVAFNLPATPTQLVLQVNPQAMNSTDKIFYLGTV
jgi:hypothetical protein